MALDAVARIHVAFGDGTDAGADDLDAHLLRGHADERVGEHLNRTGDIALDDERQVFDAGGANLLGEILEGHTRALGELRFALLHLAVLRNTLGLVAIGHNEERVAGVGHRFEAEDFDPGSMGRASAIDPVEVLGLESRLHAGDTFLVVADRDKAKGIAQYRKMKEREAQLAKSSRVTLENLSEQIRAAGVKDLPLIIKGDVTGSVEVLADSLVRIKGAHQGHPLRRWVHHRKQRGSGNCVERHRHRL